MVTSSGSGKPVDFEWLKESGCSNDFKTLVSEHCEPSKLWDYMTAVKVAAQHHAELAEHRSDLGGFDKDTFAGLVTRARRVAEGLESLYSSDLGQKAIRQAAGAGSTAEFRNIPRQLRLIVEQAQVIYRKTSHRKRPLFDEAVADFCAYVRQITGKWHDHEVSALIDAATESRDHTGDNQRSWRNEHRALLGRASRRMNEFLASGR